MGLHPALPPPFYAYATSATAAQYFGEQILAAKPGAREACLSMLRAGGSVPPHELLKQAGLDLSSPEPYQVLVRRMKLVMDKVEQLMRR